jgi:hypothetical protein
MTISGVRAVAGLRMPSRGDRPRSVIGMLTPGLPELFGTQWLGAVGGVREQGWDFICFCGCAFPSAGQKRLASALYVLVSGEALDGRIVWSTVPGIIVGRERLAGFWRRFNALLITASDFATVARDPGRGTVQGRHPGLLPGAVRAGWLVRRRQLPPAQWSAWYCQSSCASTSRPVLGDWREPDVKGVPWAGRPTRRRSGSSW